MTSTSDATQTAAAVGDESTRQYWTDYNVTLHHQFESAAESLGYFHWRNDQYFGYLDLMPVQGFDEQIVLDFGCGPGHDLVGFSVYSKPKKLVGIDISPRSLAEAEARLKLHHSPANLVLLDPSQQRLPFEEGSFDHIHASGVLHHTPNLDLLLAELRRILKSGGTMNVMVYNYESLWMHLFVAYHKRIIEQQYTDLTLREAFTKTTDSEECPIANCYTPNEFVSVGERNGFEAELTGVAISMHELIIAPARFAAIQDRRLPAECRRFLLALEADKHGYPTYNGQLAGIDACFRLRKPK